MDKTSGARLRRQNGVDVFFEYAYLFCVAVIALMSFRYTTMITEEQMPWSTELLMGFRLGLIFIVGAKTAWDRSWNVPEIVIGLLWISTSCISFQMAWRYYEIELAVLVIGAHGVSFKKIGWTYFAVSAAALITTVILAEAGVIENLVYYRGGAMRQSFGIIYPTDFTAHLFFLAALWAWLRERNITYVEIAVIAGLAVISIVLCDARNNAGCILLLALGLLGMKLARRIVSKRGKELLLPRWLRIAFIVSAPVMAIVMIVLTSQYEGDIAWMSKVNDLLSNRLALGKIAFNDYPFTAYGMDIPMNGLGGRTEWVEYYFFLDCSYINTLFRFGIVMLLCVLLTLVFSAMRESKARSWERLGILAVIALQCAFEHHLLEYCYHPFLLLPLAVSGASLWKQPGSE